MNRPECSKCESQTDVLVAGLCLRCAHLELMRLRGIEARYAGSQRALSRLLAEHTELSEEAERLRKIEKEALFGLPRKDVVKWLRAQAHLSSMPLRSWLDAIADALEKKL